MELICKVQNYDWGKIGRDSIVANLMLLDPEFHINDNEPYAELWMGTHPNGPSILKEGNVLLEEHIKENNQVLGTEVTKFSKGKLPFLFKVLSIRKALSIQVHPNKVQAEKLHQDHPAIYKDPNHKPEIAIALTPFEALCGFRPISEIKHFFSIIPELSGLIGCDKVNYLNSCIEGDQKTALKKCFTSLMTREAETTAEHLKKFLNRISTLDELSRNDMNAQLFEKLYADYPGDIGCFGIYLFNYIRLEPGEAIYLGPNEPHAYLCGDCVECMACSDNVIRAGLTPKMKDVETLINMLSYNCEPASEKLFPSQSEDDKTLLFRPPVEDFAVAKITIPPGISSYEIIKRKSASIIIVINGKAELSDGRILSNGSILFIPANKELNLKIMCGCHPMIIFQAMTNVL